MPLPPPVTNTAAPRRLGKLANISVTVAEPGISVHAMTLRVHDCGRQVLARDRIAAMTEVTRPADDPPTVSAAPECVVAGQHALGEGALWSGAEQALYWVDILGQRLHRYIPGSRMHSSWDFPEEISALSERCNAPGLLVSLRHGFALFNPAQPAAGIQRLCEPEADRPGNRFNDGKCDIAGRFWAGSMDFAAEAASGALYRLDADGACSRHDDGIAITNGPTWSADGRTLYLCETGRGLVHAYDFDAVRGTMANRRLWLRLVAGDGAPDGICTDAAGRIWIAHWGGSCVSCHDPLTAAELLRIRLPASQVTSCAFGDPNLLTLFITTARVGLGAAQLAREPLAGSVFAARVTAVGRPASRYAG
jgi:sugar lactone lactonase YvrE